MRELAVRLFPRVNFRLIPQLIAVVLVLGLAGAMAIEPTRQLFAQRNRIAQMTSEVRAMNQSNRRLERTIERLNDPDYLEQRAREQIGLVRPGETAYVVMPPARRAHKHHRRAGSKAPGPRPEPPSFAERLVSYLGL